MIKCTLIEIGNDGRAIICVGGASVGATDGAVRKTPRVTSVD